VKQAMRLDRFKEINDRRCRGRCIGDVMDEDRKATILVECQEHSKAAAVIGDRYCCFAELERHEARGRDYAITTVRRAASTSLILAPHGGSIERGTSDVAREIAGEEFNLYLFEGTKPQGNTELHITSSRFDEPSCLDILSTCDSVVTIHGCKGAIEQVLLGGLHYAMKLEMSVALQEHGVHVESSNHTFPATDPKNICNRGRTRQGVQLELSAALRRSATRYRVVDAVRAVLLAWESRAATG
jgi:phage replication-related protein YjqB (UPF0714/DUF867 family)